MLYLQGAKGPWIWIQTGASHYCPLFPAERFLFHQTPLLIFDPSLFPLLLIMLFSSLIVGSTWQTLAWLLTIERQVKSQFQMRSETRVWGKKKCAEDKRRDGRKERKHLNFIIYIIYIIYIIILNSLSKLSHLVYAALSFHSTSFHFPPTLQLQTTGFAVKVWSYRLFSPLP